MLGRDSTKRSIFLDQPSFGLSREFLVKGLDAPFVKHYFAYMRSVAELLGAPQNERTERELKETLLFEMELAQISGVHAGRRIKTFLSFTLGSFLNVLISDAKEDRRVWEGRRGRGYD